MTDMFLKFPDEAAAKAVLFDGESQKYRNIDVIGTIYKPTGDTLVGTVDSPVMEATPGYHVNVRVIDGEDAAALQAYSSTVKTPVRVWA